ncbi:MAG: DUF805 domain-containing protein [Bacteroidales bacterium]|nr:DUF805 domain-containing protein [Bacteroidales bacterium]
MNFNNIIAIVKSVILKNYVNFEGRATRPEFWWFFLFNVIVGFIFGLFGKAGTWLSGIWSLAILLPQLGLGARRLHDINKSGWLMLVSLIPLVGWVLLVYWWAQPGERTENQYGPVPTTPTAEA